MFARYLKWTVPRSFHALRLAHADRFPRTQGPLIVCLNHASWWDPVISIVLSRYLMPGADHYAPMEASALERYGFMRRLGLFPVDNSNPHTAAAQFLRGATEIFNRPNSLLWLTPEGHFTDVRTRPLRWKSGMAALLSRLPEATVVPLALEYIFWDERRPEVLALVGEPLLRNAASTSAVDDWHTALLEHMTAAQDELAALAATRDPGNFATVLSGKAGTSMPYDLWKRTHARLTGQTYTPEHRSLSQR